MSAILLLSKGKGKYVVTMTQSGAREQIQQLIEKFRREQAAGVIGQYNESETKTGFIEPLLQALGWNTQDRNEVGLEEKISGGRVDYSLKIAWRVLHGETLLRYGMVT